MPEDQILIGFSTKTKASSSPTRKDQDGMLPASDMPPRISSRLVSTAQLAEYHPEEGEAR